MKNNKLTDLLLNLGLSENEALVYLANLSLGPSTILKIAQSAGVKRTTVYSVMESLKQLGLARLDIRGFKQLYVAESPERLESMLSLRREELGKSLPELMALYNLKGGESFVRYYEGIEACKTVYENIIKEAKYGDDLLVVSDQETWYNQDPEYFNNFLERRSKVGLKVRKLLQDSPAIHEHGWGTPRFNEQIKILPAGTRLTTNMFVVPNKVVIHQIVPPILAIEIENNSVVRMNKEMFEIMWRSIPDADGTKQSYETLLFTQLQELENAIAEVIRDGQEVIDVGGVAGNIPKLVNNVSHNCHVRLIGHDKAIFKEEEYNFPSTVTEFIETEASEFFLRDAVKPASLVTFNACLHEISDHSDQKGYLKSLFENLKKHLVPSGKVIIADYYYDPAVTKTELEDFMRYLIETVGHADPPEFFIDPDLILQVAQEEDYKILHFHQNRVFKEIDRKYYIFVLEKN